jgi:dihydropteroate synthase
MAFPIFLAKREMLAVKLEGLPCSAAGILKQTALALGADCAVHRDVIRGRKRHSDVILFASRRQLDRIGARLNEQPPAARSVGVMIAALLADFEATRRDRPGLRISFPRSGASVRHYDLAHRTFIVGILNVTPDSFSDGGRYLSADDAVRHGVEMAEQGADFVDLGAESSRPGSEPVSPKVEIARLMPVLRRLRSLIKIPISIDTCKATVARACLAEGADLINDISGLRFDPAMASVVAQAKSPCVVMHIKGKPRTMQRNPRYRDLMGEIFACLKESLALALEAGIRREQVIVDPGIGFGKSVADNFTILRRLVELRALGQPIMVGPSRKSFIGRTLALPPDQRLEGSLAACVAAALHGANILRVHDVRETVRAVRIADKLQVGQEPGTEENHDDTRTNHRRTQTNTDTGSQEDVGVGRCWSVANSRKPGTRNQEPGTRWT